MNTAAQNLTTQGNQLESYITSGTLPPGIQASMEQARQSAIASVMSQHAANGTTGSSAEAQDIQNINLQVASQGANIATNLLNQGISESEFASGIYENLMQTSIAQDTALSNSIANFSGALASSGIRSLSQPTPVA